MNISGKTAVYALIGAPVAASLSPAMHNAWLADHGIDVVYVALPVTDAEAVLAALPALGLAGCNVTAPFKEHAAAAARVRSPLVERLGAANTLRIVDGAIEAHNTDAPGFVDALNAAAPTWRDRTETALVLGAGGAARAIAAGLKEAGVTRLLFANRTRDKAEAAAAALIADVRDWSGLDGAFAEADLIVNATSLGMGGGAVDWPVAACGAGALIVDAVYNPLQTNLLAQAEARGLTIVDGLGMLIHQGALAFEIWFNIRPDTTIARTRLLAVLAARG
jgi:shikimate dehydrogenase